jgi:hypothetical protein
MLADFAEYQLRFPLALHLGKGLRPRPAVKSGAREKPGFDEGQAMVASPLGTNSIDVLRAREARRRKMIKDAGIKVE